MKPISIAASVLFLISVTASAREEKLSPQFIRCIAHSEVIDPKMLECISEVYVRQDKRLNQAYTSALQ